MLAQGSVSSKKTDLLIEKFVELINSGVDSSKILVIVQNSNKKKDFSDRVLEKITVNSLEKLQIYSFFGLVYNTISDNWAKIENSIPFGTPSVLPKLVGMEISQFILRDIISEIKFEGYNSKKSLLHQLFRRYSLIVQNNLSEDEVKLRSVDILNESFADDAKLALDKFKRKTLAVRGFDYLRQGLVFNYLYKNCDYFSNIEYLFVDDGDEITPLCLDFIKYIKPQLKDYFIAYDKFGGSRLGYLSADKSACGELEKMFGNDAVQEMKCENALCEDAQVLFLNVLDDKSEKLKNFALSSVSKRAQMIDSSVQMVQNLIEHGANPSDIAIITPVIDDMLKFCLKENFSRNWLKLKFLSGSEKLSQKRFVLASLVILKLADNNLRSMVTEFDVRAILSCILEIPIKCCGKILNDFKKYGKIKNVELQNTEYTKKFEKFVTLLEKLSESKLKLSEQVYLIYEEVMDFGSASDDDINKFNFFIKELEDFESVFSTEMIDERKEDIINQIENSIISENPYSVLEIAQDELVVATPQKIIDNQVKTKYQIWLDVSSDEWVKNDTGPLYNAWVFQKTWEKSEFTLDDNLILSKQKTARILRKLMLCAQAKVFCYASLFDGSGIENFGGIEKYLKQVTETKAIASQYAFEPREDQKPVLEYKGGTMAISAVPGAGKTTILLALIIKLLNRGFSPENIFVLTYMESAARNFRERIQNACPETSQLPNISTIHGLALKILKENNNFERLGLNVDFEICDDTMRSRIIREISAKLKVSSKEQEDFDRGVSVYKMGGNRTNTAQPLTQPSPPRGEGKPLAYKHYSKDTLAKASELRKTITEAEDFLWFFLRDRRFFDLKFRRQAPFGKYIADFICLEKKIIVELDGSEHLEEKSIKHDKAREAYINKEGFYVIRFFNNDVFNKTEDVLNFLYEKIFENMQLNGEQTLAPWGRGQGEGSLSTDKKKLEKFQLFYSEYDKKLKSENLIDYEDMLTFSVRLLEENADILEYYQNICKIIIEDEAQDSSAVQQRLITLLSAKHKNLIRCGDVNQAITTTFSNADVEGFKKFISDAKSSVKMNCSQRCTKDVWKFANSLIPFAQSSEHTKNAFYDILMRPVDGKNPVEKNAVKTLILENEFSEKNYILKQIKSILNKDKNATFGILLRNNYQVARWTQFINDSGLKSITRSECLEQKGVFRAIFAVLKIVLNPFDNSNIADNYEILSELGHYKSGFYDAIKNSTIPFVQMNADDIASSDLCEFYWDLIYWIEFSSIPIEELAIKIGLFYYSSEIEKSNVYLISTLIKRLSLSNKTFESLIERLGELAKKPSLSGFKFFAEEDESSKEFLNGKVQIMTLHKSKGDEFDNVFLPEFSEKNLTLNFNKLKLKVNSRFMENVRAFNPNYKTKSDDELKEFLLEENFRLLYVAVTRAKKRLFITSSKTSKMYGKVQKVEPNIVFGLLGGNVE